MAKLRINGDSSGYVDLEAPNAASSSTIDLDQIAQTNKNNTFTGGDGVVQTISTTGNQASLKLNSPSTNNDWTITNEGNVDRLRFMVTDEVGTRFPMYMHTAGYVTTPNQPGFHVSNNTTPSGSTLTSGENNILKFDVINSNVGGGWNSSTYRYTAPITGRYMIYGQARFDGLTTYARVYVSVNGATGWWSPGLHVISSQSPPSGGTMFSGSVQGILPLSAGDYIELKGGSNNSVGTHQGEGSFGAYLLG